MSEKTVKNIPKLRFPEFFDDGEWEEKKLGSKEVCYGISSGKDKNDSNGIFDLYGSTGIIGKSLSDSHTGNFILVARVGANAGFLTKASGQFGVTDNTLVLDLHEKVNFDFVFSLLEKFGLNRLIFGSGQPLITGGQLKELALFFPKPKEQQKITDCLSSVDNLITAQSKKVETLKEHKKALMQQLFPQDGEEIPKLRFPEFKNESKWEEKTLDDVVDYENGKAHENDISENGDYIVVNSKFISTEGDIRKYTNNAFCLANIDDILMVLSDVPNGRAIAKCYLVELDDLYTVNQRICKLSSKKAVSKFLFYILDRNKYFLSFDDGVKQTNLRKEDVLNCPLLLPPTKEEQQKIANFLNSIDELITSSTKKVETLKEHKKALMQQLFPSAKEL